mgnify:CR=1 FL=1
MSTFRVIDKGGKWVVNPHAFAFADPETGNRFSPGEPTKVNVPESSWLAGQMEAGVIVYTEDPIEAPPPKKVASPAKAGPAGG